MTPQFQQTHFVGVLPPEELALSVEEGRRYMREAYGCRSGQSTPLHVTVLPPFCLEASSSVLCRVLEEGLRAGRARAFSARVSGYGAFGERTVFADVAASPEWEGLRACVLAAVQGAFPGCCRKNRRPFRPHMTVANRDIPAGACPRALLALDGLGLEGDFPVDNVAVFERHKGGWRTYAVLALE